MISREVQKSALVVLSSGAGGFYLGGRYVGGIAKATYRGSKPDWIQTAQITLWMMIAICVLCTVCWLWLDYQGDSA